MTELRYIELFLDATYAPHEQKSFIFKSRCICNYLERSLQILRFKTHWSRLNIHCSTNPEAARIRSLKHEPILEACIRFDLPSIASLSAESLQLQYAQIILSGLKAAETLTAVPLDHCVKVLKKFEEEGFVNKWIHADQYWEQWQCRCVVEAELTLDQFSLDQSIYLDGQLYTTLRVGQTKPREMLFADYFGDLSVNRNGIIIYKKGRKVLSKFSLHELRGTVF